MTLSTPSHWSAQPVTDRFIHFRGAHTINTRLSVAAAVLAASLAAVAPAAAITGGTPDENGHPYAGMFVGDFDGARSFLARFVTLP